MIAPLATELPEKPNSVLWMREGKDALALGNVTGAMVFQATVPVRSACRSPTGTSRRSRSPRRSSRSSAGRWRVGGPPPALFRRAGLAWAAMLAGFAVYAFVG